MYNLKAVIVKNEKNSRGKVNIKIRLSAKRKTRYIATEWWIDPDDWCVEAGCMYQRRPGATQLNRLIPGRIAQVEERLVGLGNRFPSMTMSAVMAYLRGNPDTMQDFYTYTESFVKTLVREKRTKTAEGYRTTMSVMKKYHKPPRLDFRDIDVAWLNGFETWMRGNGKEVNTISFYMRNIRAMFNRAINEDITGSDLYPFTKYKVKSREGDKRALTAEEITGLRYAPLERAGEIIARDFFMLTFYTIGTNVKDLVHLTRMDRDRLVFHRFKTDRSYSIKVYPEAAEIINRYRGKKYLLSFNEHYAHYTAITKYVNKHLKGVAKNDMVRIPYELTTYYARYTWATIASDLGVEKDVISHALGHATASTRDITWLYIRFNMDRVDRANRMVIDAITRTS